MSRDRPDEGFLDALRQREQRLGVEFSAVPRQIRVQHCQRLPQRAGRNRRRALELGIERRILEQNRLLEPLEGRARLEPDLVTQVGAGCLVGIECLGLPPGAVEGDHQLHAQGLAERMASHERLDGARELAVAAEPETRFHGVLGCFEPQILEPGDLDLRERLRRQVCERRPAPERVCLFEELLGDLRHVRCERFARLLDKALEPRRVDLIGVDLEHVAAGACREDLRHPALAQLRDGVLDHLRCRLRRLRAPHLFDEILEPYDGVRAHEQQCEDRALHGTPDRYGRVRLPNLEFAECPEFHHVSNTDITSGPRPVTGR